MKRGMHYMCWFKEDWNYHPSLPMKRLQQVQDIVDMNGNLLLWSCLGSAAIGIQYLDREANEEIPPRLRFYGYMNDREFCEECDKRGIRAYGVIWKAQLWEFPAEFNDDETKLLALNKERGVGKKGWLGMRELSTDRYPRIFESIKKYFPDGIKDSDGIPVVDFLEEFKTVTLDGNDVISTWLLVPGHDHVCYTPCGNKPSFMTYIKKEIEMMIDAGCAGILIDEFDAHLHAALNAGCFCKDCMKGFRGYLANHPCEESRGLDLATFDYRQFLKDRGYADHDLISFQKEKRFDIPLFKEFIKFQLKGIENNVAEIAKYAKEYSKKKYGKNIPVTANLFNCLPHSGMVRQYCDNIVGEKSGIKLRQDGFYRFGFAFAQGKECCFIEDPNDHMIQILNDIDHHKNDAYILFMMEPLAHGFNIAISYGGWMINLVKDSFYPNLEVERKMGRWLKEREHLFTNQPVADLAVVYDLQSALETELFLGGHLDKEREGGFRTFHDLIQMLCDHHVLFNVLYVSEDQPLTADRLQEYKKLIIPDATGLTNAAIEVVREWTNQGGKTATVGKVDPKLYDFRFKYQKFAEFLDWIRASGQIIDAEDIKEIGFSLHRNGNGYLLHLVNYNLNNITREIEKIPQMQFKLSWKPQNIVVHTFPETSTQAVADENLLVVKNIGIYTIIELL